MRLLGAFLGGRSGNFATMMALLLPLLVGLTGGAVDLYLHGSHRTELQAIADAAALAAAGEAGMRGWSEKAAKQVAASVIAGHLSSRKGTAVFKHRVRVDEADRHVVVTLTQDRYSYFFLGAFAPSPQITVRAVANSVSQALLCIIVGEKGGAAAFAMSANARVSAPGCSTYSNSVHPRGLSVTELARLSTQLSCTAGGYGGTLLNFQPVPLTDCPPIDDPLIARASLLDEAYAKEGCDYTELVITQSRTTLMPGAYCGGLHITGGAKVRFQPGVYVVRDGALAVDLDSGIEGTGVSFVLMGKDATLAFRNDSTVSLSAPSDGLTAGILVYAQPAGGKVRDLRIESRNAGRLEGTVYLPGDRLIVGGDLDADGVCDTVLGAVPVLDQLLCKSAVGNASSWTAIVARRLTITAGATLVLNSDYNSSDVPVPPGLGPNSARITLAQ